MDHANNNKNTKNTNITCKYINRTVGDTNNVLHSKKKKRIITKQKLQNGNKNGDRRKKQGKHSPAFAYQRIKILFILLSYMC